MAALMLALGGLNLNGCVSHAQSGFVVTSPSFSDNDMLARKFAAKGGPRKCDGDNVSPALQWSNVPAESKSFAILMADRAGRRGLGVVHWVAYDIAASAKGIEEGATTGFVGGKNTIGTTGYFGPCPDVGNAPQHYEFLVIALRIEPGRLAPGLTRDEFLKAISDHALSANSVVGRYARK